MYCSCGDPFCDGYYCNNNANGGFAIVLFVLLYPYLPFMIIGYEIMDYLANGVNLFKWGGAIGGLVAGLFFYIKIFKIFVKNYLDIKSDIIFWILSYIFASIMFMILDSIYAQNPVVVFVSKLGIGIFQWAFKAS